MARMLTTAAATAPIRKGSLSRDTADDTEPATAGPVPLPRAFLPAPGSRLISIMVKHSRGRGGAPSDSRGFAAERQADREHQQRRDFVCDERSEGVVTH